MKLDKSKKMEWEYIVNRTYSLFPMSLACFLNSKTYLKKFLFLDLDDRYAYYKTGDTYASLNTASISANKQISLYKKKGAKFLWQMAKLCEKEGDKFLKSARKFLSKDYSKKSLKELSKQLASFTEKYRTFNVFILYPWSLEDFFNKELDKLISKHEKDKEKALKMKEVFSEPIKPNDAQKEQISFLKIVKKAQEKESLSNMIDNHINKFSYFYIRWLVGELVTKKDILKRIDHSLKENKNIEEEINFLENKPVDTKKETGKIIRKYEINKRDQEMISLVKEYVYLRTYRTDVLNHSLFFIIPLLKEIAKRFNLELEEILFLSDREIIESLENGKISSDINIPERRKEFLILRLGDDLIILQGDKAKKYALTQGFMVDSNKETKEIKVKEIKGQIAYRGIVKGKVRIVLSPDDIKKVSKGDILVAVMTFPSYIMAMEKASAFVTDEGGILCHAAIISREMKKPCIIGTKIATKVLKDGDLVEVDANKGIIKIIKKEIKKAQLQHCYNRAYE